MQRLGVARPKAVACPFMCDSGQTLLERLRVVAGDLAVEAGAGQDHGELRVQARAGGTRSVYPIRARLDDRDDARWAVEAGCWLSAVMTCRAGTRWPRSCATRCDLACLSRRYER